MTWILTSTGRRLDFSIPSADQIDIIDIANGLSKCCRFSGQCRAFYSVAQHSVLVSEIVRRPVALAALLHDAAEAYTGDLPSPLKELIPQAQHVENELMHAVYEHFGLWVSPSEQQAIRHADLIMLATERRDLMPHDQEPWPCLDGVIPRIAKIEPWPHDTAWKLFLERFNFLRTGRP